MSTNEITIETAWRLCQPLLAAKLGENAFNMWLGEKSGTRAIELDGTRLVLEMPRGSYISWVEDNYVPTIESVLTQVIGAPRKVVIQEGAHMPSPMTDTSMTEGSQKALPAPALEHNMASRPLLCAHADSSNQQEDNADATSAASENSLSENNRKLLARLNPSYVFDKFVVGPNNKFAYNTCRTIAAHPGEICNPLFLYAPSGLGKTHLLQAIAREAIAFNPDARVEYLTAENFSNIFVESTIQNDTHAKMDFRNHFRNVDFLLIDDVQFFTGKVKSQEEFYYTFNELFEGRKQIVLTSDRRPQEIADIHERLVSRFEWGATVDITRPDLETRLAILNQKQNEYNEKFTADTLEYIARHITSNVRTLECSLITLKTYLAMSPEAEAFQFSHAELDRLLEKLFDEDRATQITIARIIEYVARHFDIKIQDMKGKSRLASVTLSRQIAMFLARKLTDNSLPTIAKDFNKTHPTVMHAIDLVEKKIAESEDFREDISAMTREICK